VHLDERFSELLTSTMGRIDVPPAPLALIRSRLDANRRAETSHRQLIVVAVTAALSIVAFVVLPLRSQSLVQDLETRYREALVRLGGSAPPPAPRGMVSQLNARAVTLRAAQAQVPFTIVPPAGLPVDIVHAQTFVAQTGVYSKATHAWSVGGRAVTFVYERADGRSFQLMADAYDPQMRRPPKYIFEARDPDRYGRPVIIRREHFAWSNGNQVMSATVGEGLDAREIDHIRVAMHGVALTTRTNATPDHSTKAKMYVIP
jgi:hypothetical protein